MFIVTNPTVWAAMVSLSCSICLRSGLPCDSHCTLVTFSPQRSCSELLNKCMWPCHFPAWRPPILSQWFQDGVQNLNMAHKPNIAWPSSISPAASCPRSLSFPHFTHIGLLPVPHPYDAPPPSRTSRHAIPLPRTLFLSLCLLCLVDTYLFTCLLKCPSLSTSWPGQIYQLWHSAYISVVIVHLFAWLFLNAWLPLWTICSIRAASLLVHIHYCLPA